MVLSGTVHGVLFAEVYSSVGSAADLFYVINSVGSAPWRSSTSCMALSSWRDQAPLVGDQAT